ncbi:MAG: hypothetical protein RL427_1549 [Bacteroidota bacterium]|jgi:alpha-tubulin suppressor-like RCC1 family protein
MKQKILYLLFWFVLFPSGIQAQCFSSIYFAGTHTVGQKTDGTLWCWGYGTSGQLGNGSDFSSYVPIMLSSVTTWQMVKPGKINTFAIKSNGTLWGTGSNLYGSLGIGAASGHYSVLSQIGTATNWKAIFPSENYTIGIKIDNTLWSWGANFYNQIGDGTGVQRNSPVQIGGTADWKTVASSRCNATVAIKTNGTLWGWGSNGCYVFGASDVTSFVVPQQLTLSTATDWDQVVGGGGHFLALKTDGTLWGWGSGGAGQTGRDPMQDFTSYELNQIPGNWKAMGAGSRFSMGIKTDGTLWQWGNNDITEVDPSPTNYSFVPIQVGTASTWESISCCDYNAVGLRTDGSIWAWGLNTVGQLGNGTTTTENVPTLIPIVGCDLATPQFEVRSTFVVTPIPVTDQLQVTYQGKENIDAIVVYDLSGKAVYRIAAMGTAAFSSSFPIGQLATGSYVLSLQNAGKAVMSKQFVKQ